MRILEIYKANKTYMYPSGAIATPERLTADYPATKVFPHVIETDENGQVCFAINNLSAMRSHYNIDRSLTDEEAVAAMQEIMNTPVEVVQEVTAEERIAAALELQNLRAMEDVIE